MKRLFPRLTAGLAAPAMVLGGLTIGTVAAPTVANAWTECAAPATSATVFSFNDFHGRVVDPSPSSGPNELAAKLFTTVEEARAAEGEDNVLLLSAGDNIGGSTFVSMVADDVPTLEVLDAIEVDAIAAGNHEFDKGWSDLSDRVIPFSSIPYLAANVYLAGTTTVAAPLEEYAIFERGGLRIAVIGAVTGSLPSLVSPAGIADLSIGDPVEAVNRVADELAADATIDVIIASIHEGASDGSATIEENAVGAFANIATGINENIDVVFNGHTHQVYSWETTETGAPIMQAGEYAGRLAKVELGANADGTFCGIVGTPEIVMPASTPGTQPRIQEILAISAAAVEVASELGSEVIGFANRAISTPGSGGSGTRNVESPMSNMVAQMFYDQLNAGDDEFIGVQNPGGTRASFDRGSVTYEEAALVMPFANSLMTTQLTGEQFKLVLEQQWQRRADGTEYPETPSRPFLALGLSDNVTYTFDESRPWGDRITGIYINGEPIDMAQLYTVGSGSFLISGGDNFWEFGDGVNTADTGRVDLEAWVDWIGQQDALWPDYTKRGVSLTGVPASLTEGAAPVEIVVGQPYPGGIQVDTLDMLLNESGERVSPRLPNTSVAAYIGDELIGGGTVTDGVATVHLAIPAGTSLTAGQHHVTLVVEESGTIVQFAVNVVLTDGPVQPVNVYTTPGIHHVNGRDWMTACEPYSQTGRCWTYIWSTTNVDLGGTYTTRTGWVFNNLTYLPSARSLWAGNPLGGNGVYGAKVSWTSDGRQWRTECDTAATGRNGCRSYITATVIERNEKGGFVKVTREVFNNIVLFK